MKKRLLTALLAVAMVFTAIGCGKEESNGVIKLKAHEDDKTTITVNLSDYMGMPLKGATDAELQATIENLLNSFATTDEVDDAAVDGDTVNINYAGYLDGVAFDGGTDDSEAGTDLVLGSHSFIDGFEDGLLGAKKGESRELNLTFPDPYQNNPDLAGLPVVFKVTVNAVKRTNVPVLSEEFAKQVGYESQAELEADLKGRLDKEAYQATVSQTLIDSCVTENIPSGEILKAADEFYHSIYDYCEQMATAYGMDLSYILYYMTGFTSAEEFEDYSKEYADQKIRYEYIVEAIYEDAKLNLTDDEYMKRAMEYAEQYGYTEYEEFETDYTKKTIESAVKMDYVIDYIIENAQKF